MWGVKIGQLQRRVEELDIQLHNLRGQEVEDELQQCNTQLRQCLAWESERIFQKTCALWLKEEYQILSLGYS